MTSNTSEQPIPAVDGLEIHVDNLYLLACPDCGGPLDNMPFLDKVVFICESTGVGKSECQPRAIIMTEGEEDFNHVEVIEGVNGQKALVSAMREYESQENLSNNAGWRKAVLEQEARLKMLELQG